MNAFDVDRFFQRFDTIKRGLLLMTQRDRRKLNDELARYPAIVHADLGWPPVIDDSADRIAKNHHGS